MTDVRKTPVMIQDTYAAIQRAEKALEPFVVAANQDLLLDFVPSGKCLRAIEEAEEGLRLLRNLIAPPK